MKRTSIGVITAAAALGLTSVACPPTQAVAPASSDQPQLQVHRLRTHPTNSASSSKVSTRVLQPLKQWGGQCTPSQNVSYTLLGSGHRNGPETLYANIKTTRSNTATFITTKSKTWTIEVSASLEIDASAWVAGVKASTGIKVSRTSTVTSGVSMTATVPPKSTVYANYGWQQSTFRTVLTKKYADCTSTSVSQDVAAPRMEGWVTWQ